MSGLRIERGEPMMRAVVWWIGFLVASGVHASETPANTFEQNYYRGTIGSHQVYAYLELDHQDGKVEGKYSYQGIPYADSGWLMLQGKLAKDGRIEMVELLSEPKATGVTGRFDGGMSEADRRFTGQWMPDPSTTTPARERGPLPVSWALIGRIVTYGTPPRDVIGGLEIADRSAPLGKYTDDALRVDADRVLAEARRGGTQPCCNYALTFFSDKLISVLLRTSRADDVLHLPLNFGYKGQTLARLEIADVLRGDVDLAAELPGLIKKYHRDAFSCPYEVTGFAVVGRGDLHLFVSCKPGQRHDPEQDLALSARDAARLIDPRGPFAVIVKLGGKMK